MIQDYLSLLPSYLNGANIRKHAGLIDSLTRDMYQRLMLLGSWDRMERPILIERVQSSWDNVSLIIHVHLDSAIESVSVSGDVKFFEEYSLEDTVVNPSLTFSVYGESLVNPNVIVTVKCHDGTTWVKGYPENDVPTGDVFDHDEFLDRLGALCNLPRRLYSSYPLGEARFSVPPYFGKRVIDGIVQETTEDDYYYSERLRLFLRGDVFSIISASTVESIVLFNPRRADYLPVLPEDVMFLINTKAYSNLNYDDWLSAIQRYLPVTRTAQILNSSSPSMNISVDGAYLNYFSISGLVKWNGYKLSKYSLKLLDPDGYQVGVFTTDNDGVFSGVVGGLRPSYTGKHTWRVQGIDKEDVPEVESVTLPVTKSILTNFLLHTDAWNVLTGNADYSNTGEGNIWVKSGAIITPLLLSQYDFTGDWELLVTFYYLSSTARVIIGEYGRYSNTYLDGFQVKPSDMFVENPETIHNLRFKAYDGTIYLFLDGLYTGQIYNLSEFTHSKQKWLGLIGNIKVSLAKYTEGTTLTSIPTEQENQIEARLKYTPSGLNTKVFEAEIGGLKSTRCNITFNDGAIIQGATDNTNRVKFPLAGIPYRDTKNKDILLTTRISPNNTVILHNAVRAYTGNGGLQDPPLDSNGWITEGGNSYTPIINTDYSEDIILMVTTSGTNMIGWTHDQDTNITDNILYMPQDTTTGTHHYYIEYRKQDQTITIHNDQDNTNNTYDIPDEVHMIYLATKNTDAINHGETQYHQYNTTLTPKKNEYTITKHQTSVLNVQWELQNTDLDTHILEGNATITIKDSEDNIIHTQTIDLAPYVKIPDTILTRLSIPVNEDVFKKPGQYTYTIDYSGTLLLQPATTTVNVEVLGGYNLTIDQNTYNVYYGEPWTVHGVLSRADGVVSGGIIQLLSSNNTILANTATNTDGEYSFTLDDTGMYEKTYNVRYIDEYNETHTQEWTVHLIKHDVNILVPETTEGTIGSTIEIPVTLTDENGVAVTTGEIEYTLRELITIPLEPVRIVGTNNDSLFYQFKDELTSETLTEIKENITQLQNKNMDTITAQILRYNTDHYTNDEDNMEGQGIHIHKNMITDYTVDQEFTLTLNNKVYKFTGGADPANHVVLTSGTIVELANPVYYPEEHYWEVYLNVINNNGNITHDTIEDVIGVRGLQDETNKITVALQSGNKDATNTGYYLYGEDTSIINGADKTISVSGEWIPETGERGTWTLTTHYTEAYL